MKLISALLIALITSLAHAQKIIPRIGISASKNTTRESDRNNVNEIFGVSFGIGAEFNLSPRYAIFLECGYVTKGFNFYSYVKTDQGDVIIMDNDKNHNYLEFPLELRRYFLTGRTKFYISAGGYAAVGLGGTFKGEFKTVEKNGYVSVSPFSGIIKYGYDVPGTPTNDDYYYGKKGDYGLVAGGGVMLFNKVEIDVRYSHGILGVANAYTVEKNRALQVSVAVPINLKKQVIN